MAKNYWRKGILQVKLSFLTPLNMGQGVKCWVICFIFDEEVQTKEIHVSSSGSQTSLCIRFTQRALWNRLPSPAPKCFWFSGLEVGWEFSFLSSQVKSVLLVWGLLFENICLQETRQETSRNLIKIIKSSLKVKSASFKVFVCVLYVCCCFYILPLKIQNKKLP